MSIAETLDLSNPSEQGQRVTYVEPFVAENSIGKQVPFSIERHIEEEVDGRKLAFVIGAGWTAPASAYNATRRALTTFTKFPVITLDSPYAGLRVNPLRPASLLTDAKKCVEAARMDNLLTVCDATEFEELVFVPHSLAAVSDVRTALLGHGEERFKVAGISLQQPAGIVQDSRVRSTAKRMFVDHVALQQGARFIRNPLREIELMGGATGRVLSGIGSAAVEGVYGAQDKIKHELLQFGPEGHDVPLHAVVAEHDRVFPRPAMLAGLQGLIPQENIDVIEACHLAAVREPNATMLAVAAFSLRHAIVAAR